MAEDYDVMEEDREEEAKLRKSKIYCRFIIYIMTSIYCFALGKYIQWNESSQDTSGGSSHGHKMNFYKIPAMVGIFFWFRGLLETFIFFLASKVGDEKSVKWP